MTGSPEYELDEWIASTARRVHGKPLSAIGEPNLYAFRRGHLVGSRHADDDINGFFDYARSRGADEVHFIRYIESADIVEIAIVTATETAHARLAVVLDAEGRIADLNRVTTH